MCVYLAECIALPFFTHAYGENDVFTGVLYHVAISLFARLALPTVHMHALLIACNLVVMLLVATCVGFILVQYKCTLCFIFYLSMFCVDEASA